MLHRGLDSRAFGTTPEDTVVPLWHHRDPWLTLTDSSSMCVAATRTSIRCWRQSPKLCGAATVAAPRSVDIHREQPVRKSAAVGALIH
jgi:hypothetical protein